MAPASLRAFRETDRWVNPRLRLEHDVSTWWFRVYECMTLEYGSGDPGSIAGASAPTFFLDIHDRQFLLASSLFVEEKRSLCQKATLYGTIA